MIQAAIRGGLAILVWLIGRLLISIVLKLARRSLEDLGKRIPNVVQDSAPSASISEFKPAGPVVTLAVHCHNDDYWQVLYDGNRMIREAFTEAAFPTATEQLQVLSSA